MESTTRHTGIMRLLPLTAAVIVAAISCGGLSSCKDEAPIDTAEMTADDVPTMLTRDVETMISDSGVTRYRINTPIWYVYDEVEEPYWRFPEGLHLDKFDNFFRTEATVQADSAVYLKRKQIWRLDGNVYIHNVLDEKMLTQQLFWDQRSHKLYSDSFIHIERADRTIEGYGFDSNEQMTRYSVRKVSGIFPASEFRSKGRSTADSVAADSAGTAGQPKPARPSRRPVITEVP